MEQMRFRALKRKYVPCFGIRRQSLKDTAALGQPVYKLEEERRYDWTGHASQPLAELHKLKQRHYETQRHKRQVRS